MAREFVGLLGYGAELDEDSFLSSLGFMGSSPNTAMFVAEDEGRLVGAAGVFAEPLFFNHGIVAAQERFWWVDEDHRGGVAAIKLYRAIESWARECGAKLLFMVALDDARLGKIKSAYTKLGFAPAEQAFVKEL